MAASVKVAVRVRPLNKRELDLRAIPIIEMDGKKTRICNAKLQHTTKQEGEAAREIHKDFTFDYSYWSYNEADSHFATQEQVFMDLGTDVVQNAFEGYNACVFAYGQTGSGKTHTMMGVQNPPAAQGLIPRICMDMFNRMNQGKAKGTTYNTEVSYLEIYNERVKDLLTKDHDHSLKVREHPRLGPYVEGLSTHFVGDYAGILDVMSRGNANRTTASTNMNDTSSRSHAIFTMTFVQASFIGDMPSETVSKIHLVDLAGSERADASGATGTRLKEGAHINKSLVTLGSVISALADASQSQHHHHHHNRNSHSHKSFIPYRDSVLTWLLKDSLGGNSKTIMIATISPADCNYGETLSTLRYANRAKNIINKPTINEDPNVKLIRELRAEIDKLKRKLASDISSESAVLEELQKKEAEEKSLTEEWTEKWKETQKILMEEKVLALRKAGTGVVLDSNRPHLIGIDDDVLSTGITLYHLKEGETRIGSEEGSDNYDIMLKGLGLESQHCSILLDSGVATLKPCPGSLCWVNGQQVDKPTRLFQGCVVLLGRTSMFRYNDPAEAEKLRKEGSRSHLNLSRLSFLSRSVTELGVSSENLDSSALAEESSVLEEKRKQLEAEEVRLQKESLELMQQKKLLEEQKCSYQQLQQQKEEAWKGDIQSAQKDIEERKHKLELEYAAHRRRLEEDWKRLEQQEKETLASLQSKEADLKKRRELLEWEVDQEMEQIEAEAVRVDALKTALEKKQEEVLSYGNTLLAELEEQLGNPDEDLKPLLRMGEDQFQLHLKSQSDSIKEWKLTTLASIATQREQLSSKIKELSDQIENCEDENLKIRMKDEVKRYKEDEIRLTSEVSKIQEEYDAKINKFNLVSAAVEDFRKRLAEKEKECEELNADVEKGISRMQASERRIERLESDLALIADQEKLIVSQLTHIDSSKQKLLTIIENSTEVMDEDLNSKRVLPAPTSEANPPSNDPVPSLSSSQNSGGAPEIRSLDKSKPQELVEANQEMLPSSIAVVDSVQQYTSLVQMSTEEVQIELNRLVGQINDQKTIVLECLENDSDKGELNTQVALLQELRSRYLQLESQYGGSVRQKWFGYEDEDDDSYMLDKTGGGGDITPGGESELDDSEALSSVTDHEDHIQIIVEQRVEKRLQEIFDQLRAGQTSPYLSSSGFHRRSFRRSMPSDLNHQFGSGSDEDVLSESPNQGTLGIPRSLSMNSTIWPLTTLQDGVIPGLLDVAIVNYMLRGAGGNEHYQYEIFISTPAEKWSVLRRYTRFHDLRNYMKKKYGNQISKIPFPGKRIFRRKAESVARERKKLLEDFLRNLIQICCTFITCPLHNCDSTNVRAALIAFSGFFEKGIFDSTKYGTS